MSDETVLPGQDEVRTDRASRRTSWVPVGTAAYAATCYVGFVVVLVHAVAFLADVAVPRTVDRGGPAAATVPAMAVDSALLALFAVQHSVMARAGFKRRWTAVVPRHVERSTYVLAASAVLALVFWQWRPVPTLVWDVQARWARASVWALFGLGWAWVVAMSFTIDHLDLFGLRQVARHLRGLGERPPGFAVPWPYRLVRQPMMLGFFPALLAAPSMTVGHLLFAALGCGYIVAAVPLEERDLVEAYPEYDGYRAVTPRYLPRIRR